MNFSEIRSIAWKTVAEILGITLTDVVSGTPSSSTYLSGSGAWSVPAGSGAPTNAQYLVGASDATLSAERVVTDTTTVSWDLATAAQAKANVVDASISLAKMADLAQDLFIIRTTASTGVPQTATCTAAARTVLDDATVAAMVDTLGGASSTGSGGLARATSPTFVTPLLGTPTSGVLTNCTGTAAGLTAGTVTTNANLTGPITSVGNATSIAAQTGTGTTFVVSDTPTLTTPVLTGTPNANGEAGRNSTQGAANYYDNGALGTVPKVVAVGVGTESFTNSTASDQDFTSSIFTIPANSLFTNKMYQVKLFFEFVTGVSAVTLIAYVKLGSTKVYSHPATNFTDGLTRSTCFVINFLGRAAAGAAAAVTTMPEATFLNVNTNNIDQPVNLATNGTLAIVPGVTYSVTGSTETIELQGWVVQEFN